MSKNDVSAQSKAMERMVPQERKQRPNANYYKRRLQLLMREKTAILRTLPNCLIVGASRSGNEALYTYLTSHPHILRARRREVGFFSGKYFRGVRWYRSNFPLQTTIMRHKYLSSSGVAASCEGTPFYFAHPLAAERIAHVLPEVRLIFLLRDPVARAYSHYHHELFGGHEWLPFDEAIAEEEQRICNEVDKMRTYHDYTSSEYSRHAYVDMGKYVEKLKPYFELFSKDRIMVIKSEDLFSDTQTIVDRAVDFLGLEPYKLRSIRPENSRQYMSLADSYPDLETKLRAQFLPLNRQLYSFLGRDFGW